jgi:hypothetical protein
VAIGETLQAHSANSREVLGLYRKREGARRLYEHGVFARFRYNDLKVPVVAAEELANHFQQHLQ